MPIGIDPYSCPQLETAFGTAYGHEPTMSSKNSRASYERSFSSKSSDYRGFNFDKETFGEAIRDKGENPQDYWGAPFPLADSPPVATGRYQQQDPRLRDYRGSMTSRMIAGAGPGMERLEEVNGPWDAPQPPPQPTMEDQVNQLMQQVANLRMQNQQLQNEVGDLRQGNRGRPGAPPYRPDPDYYSIPRPPGWLPPGDGPVGNWTADDPPAFLGVKPILIKMPEPFEGEHDDMERFIGDCHAYFEVFHHQF